MPRKDPYHIRWIVTAALIAAAYYALTTLLAPISYLAVQFRISEILTVLPFFTPAAIPGLFVGCIFGNLFSPLGPVDVLIGSCASLVAAFLSRKMPVWWLAPLPPVLLNGALVGMELTFIYHTPLWLNVSSVAAGEAVVCFVGGIPLMIALSHLQERLFPATSRMPVIGRAGQVKN